MNPALVKIGILVVLFLAGAASGYIYGTRSSEKAVIKQQQKDAKASAQHQEKKEEVIRYVDRVKTVIRKVPDPTGCLDTPVPADFADRLRDLDRATQSKFDARLRLPGNPGGPAHEP